MANNEEESNMAKYPIYEFYAELEDYKPKIWRRFQASSDITMARLGYIVQVLFEMTASHLMTIELERPFRTASGRASKRMELLRRFSIPCEDDELEEEDEDATKLKLSQLQTPENSRLVVWYDFGDDWRVILKPERVFEDKTLPGGELPRVLTGEGFGIVEDVGGVGGLMELADAFKRKKGAEYEQFSEWLGVEDLDMSAFDIDDMNFRLKKIPHIYKQSYEDGVYPSQQSIDLIERKYKAKEIRK
jgi:hypothetical protein